ncbi:NAD(P)/FAD-dependent oxidoreductase [Actinacidiphila sp. bgisy144]|uniref:NAD(P)/FAD-dependent oxidoreductase n=1 Tax=Actinacidiphila sp. bgisy144 TaxID=3413791 RepID=UPI003EB95FF0
MARTSTPRILVIGGGYVGMYTALRLQRRLKRHEADIVVVEPQPYMTYQPFLPEAAAGSISPRHVVVPLRRVLDQCRIIVGEARAIDADKRTVTVDTLVTTEEGGNALEIPYDYLVLAPGSVSRTLPVPGLAENGIGFRTVEEAIGLRNHVLEQLDIASSTRDAEVREAALTFVFVGGGYAGVEALGELENMARYAVRYYHNIGTDDLRWVLVEASDHILPEVGPALGRYALRELRGRNIDIRLETRLDSCEHRIAVLSDGDRLPTRTLVWTTGVKPAPLLAATGLPLSARGRLRVDATLRVEGSERVWSAGDAAAVPDLGAVPDRGAAPAPGTRGQGEAGKQAEERAGGLGEREAHGRDELPECAPNAQHAVRQARVLADNLIAVLHGGTLTDYRHVSAGAVASLGLHEGVALVRGRAIKGYPAWLIHRIYHLSRMPTFNRKARILAEWVLSGLFKREIVSLGSLEHPRAEFELAAGSERKPDAP